MIVELDWVPDRHWASRKSGWIGKDPGFWLCWYCGKAFGEKKPKTPHICEERQKLHDAQMALGWDEDWKK